MLFYSGLQPFKNIPLILSRVEDSKGGAEMDDPGERKLDKQNNLTCLMCATSQPEAL